MPRPASIPRGSSAVGNGVLMVVVPSSWADHATSCQRPAAYSVSYPADAAATPPGEASSCSRAEAVNPDPETAAVTLTTYRVQPVRQQRDALLVGAVSGKTLLETPVTHAQGMYRQLLVMPENHLVLLVRSPIRSVVRAISRSATEIPPGYRRVPSCIGLSADEAEATLAASSLKARAFSDPGGVGTFSMRVVAQAPSVGVIAPRDSIVALGLIPQ